MRLVPDSDVVVENFSAGTMNRMGLGIRSNEEPAARHHHVQPLIVGADGPLEQRQGAWANGGRDGWPALPGGIRIFGPHLTGPRLHRLRGEPPHVLIRPDGGSPPPGEDRPGSIHRLVPIRVHHFHHRDRHARIFNTRAGAAQDGQPLLSRVSPGRISLRFHLHR